MAGKKILIVDDEPLVCLSVKMVLLRDGHTIEIANGGAEALAKLTKGPIDVVFTDFAMPEMKGDQLAQAIKASNPQKPIILLTGFPPKTTPSGVDFVLEKPFSPDDLRAALTAVCPLSRN